MDFEEAQRYFAEQWKWHLHEDTFQQLDKETWICKVTTMWRTPKGEPEATFYMLHSYSYDRQRQQQFTFDEKALPALLDWCLKMSAKKPFHEPLEGVSGI